MRILITSLLFCMAFTTNAQVLTAEEAVRMAVEQNLGIRLARLDARSAELMNTVGNAGMLPTVQGVGSYSIDNSSTKQIFFSGDLRETDNADQRVLDAAVQMNWTVFDGLTMFATKDRLATLELLGQTELRQQIEATTYEVLANYYQLVQVNKAIVVQREGIRISRERLSIADASKKIGTASGLQLVQAQLDLSADSALVLVLHTQHAITMARLNNLLGRAPSTPVEVIADVPNAEVVDLAAIQQAARQANSTVQQARQQQIVADQSVKELRGALLPKLDVFANYGYTNSTSVVGILQSNQALGPDHGARINVPLFRGFRGRSTMEVAKLTREQAAISTQQAELDLEENVLNTWTSYTAARQRVLLENENLTGSRTQVDVALESYRLGLLTPVELRDVQLGLIAAEQRLIAARYEEKMAEVQLKWLAGSLL